MTDEKPLAGRGAVVTGGGRGIGEAVALALAEAGAAVVVAARSVDQIEAVAASLRESGQEAHAVRCDVADPASIARLIAEAEVRLGAVDILVNNAGIAVTAPVERITLEEWNRSLAVNTTGPFLCTQALLPGMRERGWGRIVTVASVAALRGAAYIATYAASKHAALGFVRSVAEELTDTGVTINAVCPGFVDTPLTDAAVANVMAASGRDEDAARASLLSSIGQRRLITPMEVAEVVVDLCDPDKSDYSGQAIVLDGMDEAPPAPELNAGEPKGVE